MKLEKSVDKALAAFLSVVLVLVFCVIYMANVGRTFADGEDASWRAADGFFVNLFDDGDQLTVKTSATTVGEVIERAGIILNTNDIVEPALEETIDSNNYFINIYRARPVVVKDGVTNKYVMTASYDAKTIAKNAGFVVYDGDEVSLARNTSFLESGVAETYEITHRGGSIVTEEIEIPFSVETIKDYNLAPGTQEVRQLGETGLKMMSYEVFFDNNKEVKREFIKEEIKRQPVTRIVAIGASAIERHPLTSAMGRNRYTVTKPDGRVIERQETYYDLPMSGVMAIAARECGVKAYYTVREDGVKVDAEGYVLVAAHLDYYPRCSIVETSLGLGKVYDTGTFATTNPEQFDLATDWTNRNGQ